MHIKGVFSLSGALSTEKTVVKKWSFLTRWSEL